MCIRDRLSDNLGNGYYSIGTDAQETQFNSQKGNGEFEVLEVSNSNDLNNQLDVYKRQTFSGENIVSANAKKNDSHIRLMKFPL